MYDGLLLCSLTVTGLQKLVDEATNHLGVQYCDFYYFLAILRYLFVNGYISQMAAFLSCPPTPIAVYVNGIQFNQLKEYVYLGQRFTLMEKKRQRNKKKDQSRMAGI